MEDDTRQDSMSRRHILGATAATLAAGAASHLALAQTRADVEKGEHNHSASNPGPSNKALEGLNPDSYLSPSTDRGDVEPIWYSFDLAHRRIQNGGWTRQVTQRELPSSKDLAGVNMRLTAGSYRELHWHDANEWAYMLYVGFVPAIAGHYLQNTGNDDLVFLALFKTNEFVEFSLNQWIRRLPVQMTEQHLRLTGAEIARIPDTKDNIFR